jgi:hypothetical protein
MARDAAVIATIPAALRELNQGSYAPGSNFSLSSSS